MEKISVAILTVSDRVSRGQAQDASGAGLAAAAGRRGWAVKAQAVVPDELKQIRSALKEWVEAGFDLILTTGGTGLGPRDVTPEATRQVIEKEIPGLAELMRLKGAKATPLAALSRAVAGFKGRSLIINLPGSPKGAAQSLSAVAGLLEHARHILAGGGH